MPAYGVLLLSPHLGPVLQELLRDYLDSVTLDDVVNHRQYPAVDVKFTDRDRFVEYASCGKVCGK